MLPLLLKLVVTPVLLATATLVGRRWGPNVGGVLAALPIVTGSVSFFVAVEQGSAFASRTADAALVGLAGLAWFGLAYARTCRRSGWFASLLAGYAAFLVASLAIVPLGGLPGWAAFVYVVLTLLLALRLLPAAQLGARPTPPRWDMPARMITAAILIVAITSVAQQLGPQLSGLLAALPVLFAVLIGFTHRHEGPERALGILRGFTAGLVSTALFLAIVVDAIVPLGIAPTFALATVACLALQAAAMRIMHRQNVVAASIAEAVAASRSIDRGTASSAAD